MSDEPTLHTIGHTAPAGDPAGAAGHASDCGCPDDGASVPTLDARVIPHAIRHAAVFGVLEALRPGIRVDLLAPHDPLPLLAQIDKRWGEDMEHTYVERGPEAWRLRFTRR